VSTFCGSSITVECGLAECDYVFGRFEEASGVKMKQSTQNHYNSMPSSGFIVEGTRMSLRDIMNDMKTPSNPFGVWVEGTNQTQGKVGRQEQPHIYELNKNKQSWHYGWISSRFNSSTLHVFKV